MASLVTYMHIGATDALNFCTEIVAHHNVIKAEFCKDLITLM